MDALKMVRAGLGGELSFPVADECELLNTGG